MQYDRRKSKRMSLSYPIRYQKKGSQRYGNSIGRDISDSGIGFTSNEYFPIHTQLIFELQHPDRHKFIKAVGEVIWASSEPYSERFSVGVKFMGPPLPI